MKVSKTDDYGTDLFTCQPKQLRLVYRCIGWLQARLFPAHCRLCGVATCNQLQLCIDCLEDLPWLASACSRCSHPLPALQQDSECGRCQKQSPAFDATTALFHYRTPVDYLIKRLKFSDELAISPLLSSLLARKIAQRKAPLPDLLLPVPLHTTRLRERGFNQATELARRLSRQLGIPLDHRRCRRTRQTEQQSLLSTNARRINLRNAFMVRGNLPARHVAIIDDVMTTGHTSGELARVLKQAGAEYVEVWVIAHAGR